MIDKLRAMIARHCETLRGQVAEVSDCLRQPADGPVERAALERAISLVHQIKGSAGSIGFPDASAAARSLEIELRGLADMGDSAPPDLRRRMVTALDALQVLATDLTPQMSTLYHIDISEIRSRG